MAILFKSCDPTIIEADFEDLADETIYQYLKANSETYSSAFAILEKSGLAKTLSAYNPNGDGYTLFIPDNNAIEEFIEGNAQFASLDDILNDLDFSKAMFKYHILNMSIKTNDFPYGAFPEPTLSGDFLTVNVEIETDSSFYTINNYSPVIQPNLEFSNGYIHVISKVLIPISLTSFQWIDLNTDYSIIKSAILATGFDSAFNTNTRIEGNENKNFTLLLEPDSIFYKNDIFSFEDLAEDISPGNNEYTDPGNPLYNYVAYHAITGTHFLDDLQGDNTNYSTYAFIPLNINGLGIDIKVNPGSENYDTIYNGEIINIIDYLEIFYDESNIITLSGAIHFINRILKPFTPARAISMFHFYEEPVINEYRHTVGSFLIEDTASMQRLKWWNTDLTYTKSDDASEYSWNKDYISVEGDFTVIYTIPALVQGRYNVFINANSKSNSNAVIEVFIDGEKIGGLVDLTKGGSPYMKIKLGEYIFERYEDHEIKIKSLIPGRFIWDYLRFEPF